MKLSKTCSTCKVEKERSEFNQRNSSKDKLRSECRACQAALYAASYAANPEKERARSRAWQKSNPERARANNAAWEKANPEKCRAKSAAWAKANPDKCRAKTAKRRARKKDVPGTYTDTDIQKLMDTQYAFCNGAFINPRCNVDIDLVYHIDHIIPITREGSSNWLSNLQLLCPPCNLSKHTKTWDEFIETHSNE